MRMQTSSDPAASKQTLHQDIGPGVHSLENLIPAEAGFEDRGGLLYVPKDYSREQASAFITLFHGAGGSSGQMISAYKEVADELGLILMAPDSAGQTWDLIQNRQLGQDAAFISEAIGRSLDYFNVDPEHRAISGFSDGASYALSIGLAAGHEFSHIIAFAPGFMAPQAVVDHPKIFISHGRSDTVLNIDRTSRKIVPTLRELGLRVDYQEHDGGHSLGATYLKQAMVWFLRSDKARHLSPENLDTRSQGLERT